MWFRQGMAAGLASQVVRFGYNPGGVMHHVRFRADAAHPYGVFIRDGLLEVPIQYIERIDYEGTVHDITVEGEHEFITTSGVLHNCNFCGFEKSAECPNPAAEWRALQAGLDPEAAFVAAGGDPVAVPVKNPRALPVVSSVSTCPAPSPPSSPDHPWGHG
jgi:hypothetical protein